jgi:hypothetical protein
MSCALKRSLICILLSITAGSGFCQSPSKDLKTKVDAVILEAYQSASTVFPCKLKAGGKAKMLNWKTIEKCYYEADQQIDWEDLSRKLQEIQKNGRYQKYDMINAVEASLTAHALPFDKVFLVKESEALLPLSNTILKSLPEDSLMNLPVYDKSGKRVGTYSGGYTFEKFGEISGKQQRHALFQYTDPSGRIYSSSDRLLLDSFGVPWKEADSQIGFRLSADNLMLKN